MPCLFGLLGAFFPRLGTILIWLARPRLVNAAFGGGWLIPVLGIIFLPFTTLMYVFMWGPAGLIGWDWFWLVMAVLIDISHWSSIVFQNRQRIPGYTYPVSSTRPL